MVGSVPEGPRESPLNFESPWRSNHSCALWKWHPCYANSQAAVLHKAETSSLEVCIKLRFGGSKVKKQLGYTYGCLFHRNRQENTFALHKPQCVDIDLHVDSDRSVTVVLTLASVGVDITLLVRDLEDSG